MGRLGLLSKSKPVLLQNFVELSFETSHSTAVTDTKSTLFTSANNFYEWKGPSKCKVLEI